MLYPCATTMWCFHIFIWGLFQANIDIFDCFQSAYIFAPPSLSCHTMDISPGPPLSKTNHLARLKWEAAWQEARVEAMCLQKTRCAVLMKFTLWSIDLPCSLIDAVFKNSLVWGMRSYRAAGTPVGHICLCLQNEEHSVSSKKRGLTGPPRAQWVTLSPCTRHTHTHTHTQKQYACTLSHRVRKRISYFARSHAPTYPSVVYYWLLGVKRLILSCVPIAVFLCAGCNGTSCSAAAAPSPQILHPNRCKIHTLHLEAVVVQFLAKSWVINQLWGDFIGCY